MDLFTLGMMFTTQHLSFCPCPEDAAYIIGVCGVKDLGKFTAR